MAIALVAAAGTGERLGAGLPKAFVELRGRPLLAWTMRALTAARSIERAVVAAPPGFEARVEAIAVEACPGLPLTVVAGGASRAESVKLALAAAEGATVVAVHDAARPLVSGELFDRCVSSLESGRCEAAVAAIPVTDTIKQVGDGARVVTTLDRSTLWAAQTPQAFRAETLYDALGSGGNLAGATDEAQLVERAGGRVEVVEAGAENIKVTVPADLRLASMLLSDAD